MEENVKSTVVNYFETEQGKVCSFGIKGENAFDLWYFPNDVGQALFIKKINFDEGESVFSIMGVLSKDKDIAFLVEEIEKNEVERFEMSD